MSYSEKEAMINSMVGPVPMILAGVKAQNTLTVGKVLTRS